MSQIPASARELRQSAKHMYRQAETLRADVAGGYGSLLLRFYGIECHMKDIYLVHTMRRPQGDTDDIPKGTFGRSGHDLQAGLKSLRIPCWLPEVEKMKIPGKPRYTPGSAEPLRTDKIVEIEEAHQVWRYGIANEGSEVAGVWLDALIQWLRTQHP